MLRCVMEVAMSLHTQDYLDLGEALLGLLVTTFGMWKAHAMSQYPAGSHQELTGAVLTADSTLKEGMISAAQGAPGKASG